MASSSLSVSLGTGNGRVNGVSISALNARTRTSRASVVAAVSSWTTRTSAVDNVWWSVTWAPEISIFVVVAASGTGNRVMTSPDGINWTVRVSPVDNNWRSVCWSPELSIFVAVAQSGTGNRVMTSPDGITWTARTSATDNDWWSVTWAPELSIFVAVAASGVGNRVMTSPDGITWTSRSSAADNNWWSVTWAPELSIFVVVANQLGASNQVMTSPDGMTWTARTSAADNGWLSVTWAPELSIFAAVAYTGTGNRVMTSPDGITWTSRASAADNIWHYVTWAPELSVFVAVAYSGSGNRVMTSPDGITWTTRASAADNGWLSVTWAPELSIFVAVAYTGTGNRVMTSAIGMPNSKSVVKALPSQMTVLPNGNVGIGTTDPRSLLHISNKGAIYNNHTVFDSIGWNPSGSKTLLSTCNPYSSLAPLPNGGGIVLCWRYESSYYYINIAGTAFFTGQHAGIPDDLNIKQNIANYVGYIVSANDTGYASYNNNNKVTGKQAITINEALPNISLSSKNNDPTVFGVISNQRGNGQSAVNPDGSTQLDENDEGFDNGLNDRVRINSFGEGAIWVSNINGNISNGDYITSSIVPGIGRKQNDDILHNYTVAKATMSCNFELNSPKYNSIEFYYNNIKYIRAFIGCSYHCG